MRDAGIITVLLRDPVPALARQVHEPYPLDRLDVRNLPPDFDFGQAYVTLGTSLPDNGHADAWSMDGYARRTSRFVIELAEQATGVVLHRAGALVVAIDEFVAMLGDLADPECRPFAAWLDLGLSDRAGKRVYGTFGMSTFGLPDVVSPIRPNDSWSRSRRHEAVLVACHRMIRTNEALAIDARLDVPLRASVGGWPLEHAAKEATLGYRVAESDTILELVPDPEPNLAAGWPDEIQLNAYQALFEQGLRSIIPSDLVREDPSQDPPFSVEVRDRHDGRRYLVVTNGFGPGGLIELGAWVPAHAPALIQLVGLLARELRSTPVRWQPCDTLASPIEELGVAGFVLADGGAVDIAPNTPRVQLLLLVPLTPGDYAPARGGNARAYLEAHPAGPNTWTPFLMQLQGGTD